MDNDPQNNPSNPEQERWDNLMDKSFQLLTAREAQIDKFDDDPEGNPIYHLNLEVDASAESTLSRLGYGKVELNYVPATGSFEDNTYYGETVSVVAYGPDKATTLETYSIFKDYFGKVELEVFEDDTSPLFSDETPLTRPATTEETLQMASLLNAVQENLTFDQESE
jgi:hypothetical protein